VKGNGNKIKQTNKQTNKQTHKQKATKKTYEKKKIQQTKTNSTTQKNYIPLPTYRDTQPTLESYVKKKKKKKF